MVILYNFILICSLSNCRVTLQGPHITGILICSLLSIPQQASLNRLQWLYTTNAIAECYTVTDMELDHNVDKLIPSVKISELINFSLQTTNPALELPTQMDESLPQLLL